MLELPTAEVRLHSNCTKAKRNENMDVKIGDKLLIFLV
jgi:hypothetical protein